MMDLKTFLEAVEEMRTAQKEYFRTKRNIEQCKRLERKVDLACRKLRDGSRELFER